MSSHGFWLRCALTQSLLHNRKEYRPALRTASRAIMVKNILAFCLLAFLAVAVYSEPVSPASAPSCPSILSAAVTLFQSRVLMTYDCDLHMLQAQRCGCAKEAAEKGLTGAKSCDASTLDVCGSCRSSFYGCSNGACPFPGASRDGVCHEPGGTHRVW
jgi:hypothetical protein